ncbi:MAG: DUF3524 domain-containing protein [Acidimicrobiales bacterium]
MKLLIVEPWLGGSHAQWAEGYRAVSVHDVSIVGLPADRWRWRLRGGAVPLAELVQRHVATKGRPDVVLVSSPLDAARLIGLLRSELEGVPVAVYQHESQLLYPNARGVASNDADALYDWFSWLAADVVFFNSDWHRRQVVAELPAFVRRLPDDDHVRSIDRVIESFETLPLGLDLSWAAPSAERFDGTGPVVLWPHRWEPDKDPAAFARAVDRLVEVGLDARLVLAGASGPLDDDVRRRVVDRHRRRVLAAGPFGVEEYRDWVCRSDVVVSCAHHDFFGVGVAEAVAAGCVPVVPDALNYPDLLGDAAGAFGYRPGSFGTRLADVVRDLDRWRAELPAAVAAVRCHDWGVMAAIYDQRLEALAR